LRVIYLSGLDFRDTRFGQISCISKSVLRQALDAALLADKSSEQDAKAIHFRDFQ
jgi:hypothetical protein